MKADDLVMLLKKNTHRFHELSIELQNVFRKATKRNCLYFDWETLEWKDKYISNIRGFHDKSIYRIKPDYKRKTKKG